MKQSAVAIGTFDGFHLGHRLLVRRLIETAKRHGLRSVIVSLSRPVKPVSGILTTEDEKTDLLGQCPLDEIIVIPAVKELLSQSAAEFFEGFLLKGLKMKHLVVGRNFAFGRGRQGDTDWLKKECSKSSTDITVVEPLKSRGVIISSSLIRDLLKRGDLSRANALLGRFYSFNGKPEKGRGFGRKIGVPTVNLSVPEEKILPAGVYEAVISSGKIDWPGVINIGVRPTFFSEGKTVPEMHIFGFSGRWPKKNSCVFLCSKMRKEKRFGGVTKLKEQISSDIAAARKYFGLPG